MSMSISCDPTKIWVLSKHEILNRYNVSGCDPTKIWVLSKLLEKKYIHLTGCDPTKIWVLSKLKIFSLHSEGLKPLLLIFARSNYLNRLLTTLDF